MTKNLAVVETNHPARSPRSRFVTLAGNPNSGKTSLFNALTGAFQHVGNYPGVTVERKEGKRHYRGLDLRIMDLPGTYSLATNSLEERIARDVLVTESPDVTVSVVDASALERNLYLTVQLLELGLPVVIALNMVDVAKSRGTVVDAKKLSGLLRSPVVTTVARRAKGIEGLLEAIRERSTFPAPSEFKIDYGPDIEREIERLDGLLALADPEIEPMARRGLAVALLEGIDTERTQGLGEGIRNAAGDAIDRLERLHGDSMDILIAERRHGAAMGLARQTVRTSAERQRDLTDLIDRVLVIPLMSCSARLPIYALIIPAFFVTQWRATVLWIMYVIGIALAMASAWLLRKTLFAGEGLPFLMELPPYRLPTIRSVFQHMVERSWMYIRKAGTIILGISIVMWALATFPRLDPETVAGGEPTTATTSAQAEDDLAARQLAHSYVGRIGHAMEPIVAPMGFDWRIGTAMVGAFAAKEVFVAQMGIVYSVGSPDESGADSLRERLRTDYSPLVGFCIMLFALIASPCMATVAVIRRESGSWGWAAFQFFGLTVLAWIVTAIVYQTGTALGLGV